METLLDGRVIYVSWRCHLAGKLMFSCTKISKQAKSKKHASKNHVTSLHVAEPSITIQIIADAATCQRCTKPRHIVTDEGDETMNNDLK